MKINIDKYEVWALDYLEGNLSDHQRQMFEGFLEDHPDLKAEMEGIGQIRLVPDETMVYPDKSALYKTHRATILPWFGLHYPVAAAVAFILILGAGYFIWEGSLWPASTKVSDMTESPNPVIQPTSPISGTEEMVTSQQEAGNHEQKDLSFVPAPSIDVEEESVPEKTISNFTETQKHIQERQQDLSIRSVTIDKSELMEDEQPVQSVAVSTMEKENITDSKQHGQTVAMLPVQEGLVASPARTAIALDRPSSSPVSREFKVHIPGEFLSETWSNINVASLKEKVIPSFISKKLNL